MVMVTLNGNIKNDIFSNIKDNKHKRYVNDVTIINQYGIDSDQREPYNTHS